MKLTNKTILIVGASSGIGRKVAEILSLSNNNLILTARRQELLDEAAQVIEANGSRCLAIATDAMDEQKAEAAVQQAVKHFGQIDVALLNIGAGPSFNMSKTSAEDVKQNMQLNYDSMVNYLIPVIQQMKSQGQGIIAHTNSLAGFVGLPMQGPYSAAKAAGRILMDSCRIELADFNISVVSLYPGFVATQRVLDDGIPSPFQISETQAVNYIIKGIEAKKADVLFPASLKCLITLARVLPKPLLSKILKRTIPADY